MGLGLQQRAATSRPTTALRARFDAPPAAAHAPKGSRLCPELDCLRGWLSASTIAAAERRALAVGVGADRVLISAGLLDEEIYVRLLADALGIAFEPLDNTPRNACPRDDQCLVETAATGLLPLVIAGDVRLAISPQGTAARRITELVRSNPVLAKHLRLTTTARLQAFVTRHAGAAITEYAASALVKTWPHMSAASSRRRLSLATALLVCAAGFGALVTAPAVVKFVTGLLLTLIFVGWMALRVTGALIRPDRPAKGPQLRDQDLPVYTVLAPLYREVASIPGLLAALRRLDYPPEKLDIKLIVEPDDVETRVALERLKLRPPFEVVVAPAAGPRTKPKALNAALPFARGTFTVIYDAEDRPEPRQLRDAIAAFRAHGDKVACVQASLTIDNTADNWITAMFTAEYAGQFDVFLPALSRLKLPLPLGGSSNHFRTATLRAVGGWDPYNVTEDADLGVRLARFGYRSIAIATATYEEAPARLSPWLRQRTRWFKGWMRLVNRLGKINKISYLNDLVVISPA